MDDSEAERNGQHGNDHERQPGPGERHGQGEEPLVQPQVEREPADEQGGEGQRQEGERDVE